MRILTRTDELRAFCAAALTHPYVTIDTEFLRERTYYARLCLIQMAFPGKGEDTGVLVDTLSDDLDLQPLYDLFRNESVVKVFHAARQDLEIFYVEGGVFPKPFFDTQVAAMVCGFGDQVGYETLVRKIARQSIDKSSRFTDWSRRPLSDKQQHYALADVTHLRDVYEVLAERIKTTKRTAWVEEELEMLTDPATYTITPDQAWRRVKTRTHSPRFLGLVRELARFREEFAQRRNVPRSRVYKDDALLELASAKPQNLEDLGRSRLLLREARKGDIAEGILKAIADGLACPDKNLPKPPAQKARGPGNEGLSDLLRVLLKAKAEQAGVAPKLIASASELEDIASGDTDGHALKGWRRDVFGADALKLCQGKIALSADGSSVKLIEL
ncbi:MAG: ribonuclease D [Rhodobacteraceae bacterium]|nr:ribonuclease D [Paracoccaceae bacterium]